MCYRSLSECCTRSQHLQSLSLPHSPSSALLEQQTLAPHLSPSRRRTLYYIVYSGKFTFVSQRRWRRSATTEINVHLPLSLASHQARLLLLVCLSRASQAKKGFCHINCNPAVCWLSSEAGLQLKSRNLCSLKSAGATNLLQILGQLMAVKHL